MISESWIVNYLQQAFPFLPEGYEGIGDDAAIIPLQGEECLVISKDLLVENIHFRTSYHDPQSLAHKALHTNLSDMAAMGARGSMVLLGLSLPRSTPQEWLQGFLEKFIQSCKDHQILLLGGDTTASHESIGISVTILSRTLIHHLKRRSTAKAGDIIGVVGTLGEACAGFNLLERQMSQGKSLIKKFLYPNARVEEGVWLGQQAGVTAMMDISDGLYVDLRRLCAASTVGAHIHQENLNPTPGLLEVCQWMNEDPYRFMLAGGEDYGLLITINQEYHERLTQEFIQRFGYEINKIGTIQHDRSIQLLNRGVELPFNYPTFSHFNERR